MAPAKKPAKTQNITIAKPIMPIVESNSFPYKPRERLYLKETRKRITKATQTGPSRINARVIISVQVSRSISITPT
jgi:hypothetical protein